MYSFLSELENRILEETDNNGGLMELDFSINDHYEYFLKKVGGLDSFLAKYPHLASVIEKKRQTPLVCQEKNFLYGYNEGSEDKMVIENIMFQPPQNPGMGVNETGGKALSRISANYVNHQDAIAINAEMYDVANGKLLRAESIEEENTHKAYCNIEGEYQNYIKDEPREFLVVADFFCSEDNSTKSPSLKAYVAKASSFTLDGADNIIAEFKLNKPVIKEEHRNDPTHKEIKVAYQRSGQLTDYDYCNNDQPFVDPDKKEKIMVRLPFSITIKTSDKYAVLGLSEEDGYRLYLENIENGIVNHYCNFSDITQVLGDPDDLGDHRLDVVFPEKWNNVLDFTKHGYTASTRVDIYGQLAIKVRSKNFTKPMVIRISVKSDGSEYDKRNIKADKIYIQWGCMAKDTRILLADFTEKMVSELQIGDIVLNANKEPVKIKDIIKGKEENLFLIHTISGANIKLTKEHIVYTESKILPVRDLKIGDKLKTLDGTDEIIKIEKISYNDLVYNLYFEPQSTIIGNGFIIGDSIMQDSIKEARVYEY